MAKYAVRTDLAVESKEKFEKDQVEIEGVVIHETYDRHRDIRTTVVSVESEKGAQIMEKPMGHYITIEAAGLTQSGETCHRQIAGELAHHLQKIMGLDQKKRIPTVLQQYMFAYNLKVFCMAAYKFFYFLKFRHILLAFYGVLWCETPGRN